MAGRARRRGGRLRRRIGSSLPIVLATLVLASCLDRPASRRLHDEIGRIRAAGEPLTFEELRAGQSAGDGADGAPDYRAAIALFVGPVLPPTLTLIEHALSRRRLPSASETSNLCGNVGAPTLRASAGGTIECVAPVSTKKSAVALRRAESLALTTM